MIKHYYKCFEWHIRIEENGVISFKMFLKDTVEYTTFTTKIRGMVTRSVKAMSGNRLVKTVFVAKQMLYRMFEKVINKRCTRYSGV
jgi:hypothetical protein